MAFKRKAYPMPTYKNITAINIPIMGNSFLLIGGSAIFKNSAMLGNII